MYCVRHHSPGFVVVNDVLGKIIYATKNYVEYEAPRESGTVVRRIDVAPASPDSNASCRGESGVPRRDL